MVQHWESHEKSMRVPWTNIGSLMDVPWSHYKSMGDPWGIPWVRTTVHTHGSPMAVPLATEDPCKAPTKPIGRPWTSTVNPWESYRSHMGVT